MELEIVKWLVGMFVAAIVALWVRVEMSQKDIVKRLGDCESDRENLWREISGLSKSIKTK